MTPIRVKVCGITRPEDAALAARLGASALGFVFWPTSPRVVTVARARQIVETLPPFVVRVGVFVNAPPHEVRAIAGAVGLDAIQLHGDEPSDAFASLGRRIIRAVSLTGPHDVSDAAALPASVTPLVDAADPVRRGGTGQTADWTLAADLARRRPVILAGGLTSDNVAAAIGAVRPWAVDVSSGVEDEPGIKSAARLHAFFEAMRAGEGVRV